MTFLRARIARTVLVLGAVAAGPLLVPTGATAQSIEAALLETTCSYPQVEAAIRAEAPELAAILDANPEGKTKLQEFLALPVEQRKQRSQEYLDTHPEARTRMEERSNAPEAQRYRDIARRIADTCHNY
ncbi:hemophore-related protein [Nocardia paucivorans]|uniref:hemophore-related protein n=1 Tax=Nocardia paucivorans TaxID=114259 RepID=UPI0003169C7E|nr:hemophore-related protein [Nocardia paucivorans]